MSHRTKIEQRNPSPPVILLDYWTGHRCRTPSPAAAGRLAPSTQVFARHVEPPWMRTSKAISLSDGRDWCPGKQRRVRRYLSHSDDGTLARSFGQPHNFPLPEVCPAGEQVAPADLQGSRFRSERTLTSKAVIARPLLR